MRNKQNGDPFMKPLLHSTASGQKLDSVPLICGALHFICAWKIWKLRNQTKHHCRLKLTSQCPWESGPESRRSSWTSMGRAPSLHRKSQSVEMESLLSDTHTSSNHSSREQSLDQQEYLQVPMLHDCNGTTFHLPDHCCDDPLMTTHYHTDQEEEEIEEVQFPALVLFIMWWKHIDVRVFKWLMLKRQWNGIDAVLPLLFLVNSKY